MLIMIVSPIYEIVLLSTNVMKIYVDRMWSVILAFYSVYRSRNYCTITYGN